MKIKVTELTSDVIPCNDKYKNDWGIEKTFNAFKVNRISGTRIYITVFNGQMKLTQIAKKMEFSNGLISIKIGKESFTIGKYEAVA